MLSAVSIQAHWRLNHPLPSVHYISIKEKSTTSPIIEHSVSFPLNYVIPDVYLKVNPILRGNCECGPPLKPIFLGRGDRGNEAQQGTIRVHFIPCHRPAIVLPDSCEWQRQRGHNGEFHRLCGEGRAKTCALLSRQSGARMTDNWYLGFKRNENESESRAS